MSTEIKDKEIIISRIIKAPRSRVWQAWNDPVHISEWFGPNGFTTTTTEMDFRTGGVWRHVMLGPDGKEYPAKLVYLEIKEPERIFFTLEDDGVDLGLKPFQAEVLFEDLGEATKVTLHHIFDSPEELAKQKKIGAVEGGEQTLERLDAFVTNSGAH